MRNNLINARKNKCLTQQQIADKIGISVRQYQNLEYGTTNSNLEIWQKLKDVLNVSSVDYLIKDDTNN